MSWLATLGVGFISAIIGVFGVGTLGALCVDWYRISGREAGSAYFVIFLGLIGGIVGFAIGVLGARVVAAGTAPSFIKAVGVVAGSSVSLLLVATLICWLAADLDTTLGGNAVELHAEVRCPPGFVIPADATDEHWYAHIDTRSRRVTSRSALRLDEARQENGRWIIPVTLPLATSVREKLLYVRFAENVQLFIPVFPSKPGQRYFVWSEWQDGGWEPGKPRPEPAQRFNLRFRVQIVPGPETLHEIQAKKQVGETAALAALTPDSPLEDCLQFTHYRHSQERRVAAGALIGRRPGVVTEMSAQILSPDRDTADRALRALAYIKPLPVELAAPVARVGEKVIEVIEKFNVTKPEDDPEEKSVAEVAALFSGWLEAHQALHECAGVDGLPFLQKVLELSLQRQDSQATKTDVARVAQFYVTKWSRPMAAVSSDPKTF